MSILGFGEVGRAVAAQLAQVRRPFRVVSVTDRSGTVCDDGGLDVATLVERKRANRGLGGIAARDAAWAAREVDADVVVDALPTDLRDGGASVALAVDALRCGKDVVAASKGALALRWAQIRAAEEETGRRYLASASVAGGTPILELLRVAFRGDTLDRFDAVLNGSTNHILSQLEDGLRWEDALRDARARGILEADPSLDLLGLDAAAKGIILANHAWGRAWTLADARAQGIAGITEREAREARASGLAIRLVVRADARRGVFAAPVTLPREHALVVEGKENAIRLKLAHAGLITLRGPGAGGAQTASAVVSDLISLASCPASASATRRIASDRPPLAA